MAINQDISLENIFDRLDGDLTLAFGDTGEAPPFHEWVKGVILDGKPFTYNRHEYLIEPYQDNHPHQVEMKGTQMGLTSKAMLRVAYGARYDDKLRGFLYFFPSKTDVLEFTKGRFNPMIIDNPDTIGSWVRDTDSASIKHIWNGIITFRGMQSRVGMKGVPGDFVVIDELDEAPIDFVFWIKKRLAHSEEKRILKLSNPTLPDYGIDFEFQSSDQRYWLLKCEKCGKYTDLVETFPDCFVTFKGETIRLCQHCRDRALNPSVGQWVARRPSITEKRGRQYSQLWSHFISPAEILDEFRTTKRIGDFWNLTVGIGYVEAENRLGIQEVLKLCGNDGILTEDPGPCFMGVDPGGRIHVVISKRHPEKRGQIIHLGVYDDFEELDRLMTNFNVTRCVIDGQFEQRNCRAFAKRHPGRVFLCYYSIRQKVEARWNEPEAIVDCNRTETLDESHKEVLDKDIVLPGECDVVREFARHLHNIAKVIEEEERKDKKTGKTEKTGAKFWVYKTLGEDHFRHAFNYDVMARHYGSDSFFADVVMR